MSTSTRETPYFHSMRDEGSAAVPQGRGTELHSTYFEFHVTLPDVIVGPAEELSGSELLRAAQLTGTFDFLHAPEEDGYNDLMPPREL